MKKLHSVTGLLLLVCATAAADETNWNNLPDMASTPSSWTYEHTPGWYFYAGVGSGITMFVFGLSFRALRRIDKEDMI